MQLSHGFRSAGGENWAWRYWRAERGGLSASRRGSLRFHAGWHLRSWGFERALPADEIGNGNLAVEHTNTLYQYVTNLHLAVTGSPTFTAAGAFTGDPKLNSSYHLTSDSPASNAGVNAGVFTDLDGELRLFGDGFDIGADEMISHSVYLPAVLRSP